MSSEAAINRVVKVISYGSLVLFFVFVASGMLKMQGKLLPEHYAKMTVYYRRVHALMFKNPHMSSFDDTSLR